jgi:branched-chain amino acid transport system ATP-binding protein
VKPLLRVDNVSKRFGGLVAVDSLSLDVEEGEVLGVVGPNGAGKSTLLSLVAGSQRPSTGEIWLDGRRIDGLRAFQVARLGIGRTFQTPRPFHRMTVRDNLRVAAAARATEGRGRRLDVDAILELTGLSHLADRPAGALTLLELKRLELARQLALGPRLLLLDEIGAGLTGSELARLADFLTEIRELGLTLVIIEHVLHFVMDLADRVAVMDMGRVRAVGPPEEIARDPLVIDAYLGERQERNSPENRPRVSVTAPDAGKGEEAGDVLVRATDLWASYGMVRALNGVGLEVRAGQAVAVLGPNGAGKSTLCKALLGLVPLQSGTVEVDGEDITRWPTERRVRESRLVLCPEGRHVFAAQTVLENLKLGRVASRGARDDRLDMVLDLFPELETRTGQLAGTLSGGEQQMLAIARALMSNPRVLIVDELSLGLTPAVGMRIYERLHRMLERGLTLLLVEQYISEVLATASSVYLLERGTVIFGGDPWDIGEEDLANVYLRGQGYSKKGSPRSSVGAPAIEGG